MARVVLIAALLMAQPALAGDWSAELENRYNGGDWSGGYAGVYAGAGISTGRAQLGDFGGALIPLDISNGLFPASISNGNAGLAGGALAGYNFQSGSFVGGIEADVGYAWTKSSHFYSRVDPQPNPIFNGVDTNTTYETDFGAMGSLRLRGGMAIGNTLVYATGGAAVGHVENRFSLAIPQLAYTSPSDWRTSGTRFGYTLGVGVEHKLASNVRIRLEAMYVNLADSVVRAVDPVTFPGEHINYRFSNDMFMPRLAVTVGF